ncbi:hypothetical protein GCM10009039_33050 [Halocalculus aciditolerans]|uniref:Uncharacterized protein n=2 Tax=Halocalculus aciditolerans TaxID=1383812 RepID=A0A830FN60_9EURY|nr:hypothetical protein GCM10009039_33050 [Halocalculus aciditolerans]
MLGGRRERSMTRDGSSQGVSFAGVDVSELPLAEVESFVENRGEDAYLERRVSRTYVGRE